jgi:predicted AAA+ superfamily ATPase
LAKTDPQAFVRQAPGQTLVIDEVQRHLPLILSIKMAVDQDPRPGQFLLTGSSDLLALPALPDSLAGRAVTIKLGGLSQGELADRWDDFAAWARAIPATVLDYQSNWGRVDYVSALAAGGYPESRKLGQRARGYWIDGYLGRIVTRDLSDVSSGLASNRLLEVLRLVAASQGSETVPARIANDLGIAPASVTNYLNALRTMRLLDDLSPWTPNLTTREIGRRKLSVADSALAMQLNRLNPEALADQFGNDYLGGLVEAFVTGELTKQQGWSTERFNLYHFRDRNGTEVDLVIEYGDGSVFLIEVKASQTYQPAHTLGIRALAAKLGSRFAGGAVLGLASEPKLLGDRIWGLPLSILWEHGSVNRD